VLLMSDGTAGAEVARMLGYTDVQVSRIRARYLKERLDSIHDRERPGRPKSISPRRIAQVVALTLSRPPRGLNRWTVREVARRTRIAPSAVHGIWRQHSLKPHQLRTFKFTTDPEAEDKIQDVVGLYLHPPKNAVVLCFDEKTQIQALSRTQPLLPLRPGLPARRTHDYRRNGTTDLFAALNIATGKVVGQCRPSHTATDFLAFLRTITRAYPEGDIHIVLDNHSAHSTAEVEEWMAKNPRVQFHFTPKGASWMNMVEGWFGIITRKSIRRGSFDTLRALVNHIKEFLRLWNSNPTPFVWTKAPAEVVRKAVRHRSY
jgi:transposase